MDREVDDFQRSGTRTAKVTFVMLVIDKFHDSKSIAGADTAGPRSSFRALL